MPTHHEAIQVLHQKLSHALESSDVVLSDESHLHHGHANFDPSRVHLALTAASKHFNHLTEVEKQRLIYRILRDDMTTFIHALRFEKLTGI